MGQITCGCEGCATSRQGCGVEQVGPQLRDLVRLQAYQAHSRHRLQATVQLTYDMYAPPVLCQVRGDRLTVAAVCDPQCSSHSLDDCSPVLTAVRGRKAHSSLSLENRAWLRLTDVTTPL